MTPTIQAQLTFEQIKQQARKLVGDEMAQLLADHDTALMHHATEIGQLRATLDDHITKAVAHAERIETLIASLQARVALLEPQ